MILQIVITLITFNMLQRNGICSFLKILSDNISHSLLSLKVIYPPSKRRLVDPLGFIRNVV